MRFARSTRVFYALLTGMLAVALAPQTQAQPQAFSNAQLKSFTAATEAVTTINMEYGNRVQNAKSPDEVLELRDEAQREMINAVQHEGLSVATYSAIAQEAQRSPKLRQRIQQLHGD
jgi:hypothetical protein